MIQHVEWTIHMFACSHAPHPSWRMLTSRVSWIGMEDHRNITLFPALPMLETEPLLCQVIVGGKTAQAVKLVNEKYILKK